MITINLERKELSLLKDHDRSPSLPFGDVYTTSVVGHKAWMMSHNGRTLQKKQMMQKENEINEQT